jgi:putative heme-binding domain-containing protein
MLAATIALFLQAGGSPYLEDRFDLPKGFRIYKVAERDLCGGSYDIAFDGSGRLLVGDGTQIRRLEDTNGDGVFDRSEVIATGLGSRGPQGLLVWGDRVYAVGGDGLQLFTGYPGTLTPAGRLGAPFATGGDHTAHQIFRGHDDHLYFIVGDGAGARDRVHITEPSSPARTERACSIFRISPDGRKWECIGTGGRNSPNLGMNAVGDLFSLDSDMEWHVDVPWWRPVRLHHWLTGGDQGWQEVGAYPPYYIDNLPGIHDIGRGSPDWGVFYEHSSFPARYRDVYFVCDYRSKSATSGGYATAGRLFAFTLKRSGAGWTAASEVFAQPKSGAKDDKGRPIDFGLVDIEVGPDGSLYLSDHGQGIWRIVYDPDGREQRPPQIAPVMVVGKHLGGVLALPQPASEWSRLRREEIRESLGKEFATGLEKVATDPSVDPSTRLVALRHLSSRFAEISHEFVLRIAKDSDPEIRGYAAWLLGIQRRKEGATALATQLIKDAEPFVRRRGLEALMRNPPSPDQLGPVISLLEDPDRLIRYAAMIALTHHPADGWFDKAVTGRGVQSRLRALVAADLRREAPAAARQTSLLTGLMRDLPRGSSREDRLDLLRVLGRFRASAKTEELSRYLLQGEIDADPQIRWEEARLIGEHKIGGGFPRLVAWLESEKDSVTQFHVAQALARLPDGWTPLEEARAVAWFLNTQRGWFAEPGGKGLQFPAFWSTVLTQFAETHRTALLASIDKVDLKGLLGKAAIQGLAATEGASERLIRLYAARTDPESRERILSAFDRVRTPDARAFLVRELRVIKEDRPRGAALMGLAAQAPSEESRFFLEEGLSHRDREVARCCAIGLAGFPSGLRRETARVAIGRMQERELTAAFDRLLVALSGVRREGDIRDGGAFWKAWYAEKFGEPFRPPVAESARERSNEELRKFLLSEEARGGKPELGRPIYAALCVRCHGGTDDVAAGTVLFGPDLTGVTRRMPREEIADSIVFPSKVVAERFRATAVALANGDVLSGFVTEQDEKTLTLVDAARVHRLEKSKIQASKPQETSLMPEFLVNRLTDAALRDLLAFLEEVGSKPEKK